MALPPYTGPNPRCTKCGNHGAYTVHQTDMTGERLKRQCDRCGYEWDEATIEQRPPLHTGNAEDCPACPRATSPGTWRAACPGPA